MEIKILLAAIGIMVGIFSVSRLAPSKVNFDNMPKVEVMSPNQVKLEKSEWWNNGGVVGIVQYTGSMKPYLVGGEIVLGKKLEGKPVKGMLISFKRWDSPSVLHQIIDVSDTRFKAKGINNSRDDGWYTHDKIKYNVIRIIRQNES